MKNNPNAQFWLTDRQEYTHAIDFSKELQEINATSTNESLNNNAEEVRLNSIYSVTFQQMV